MSLFEIDAAIEFFVDCEPVPQPRQRHAYRNGMIMSYVPKDHPVHTFKEMARIRARSVFQGPPLECPLKVYFLFLLPRPGRLIWKSKAMPRQWAPGRPDTDNFCKSIMDALNKFVWADDSQIVALSAQKMYASGDEASGVHVKIEELP